ncbi:MAG TPA: hypothetical protein VD884_05680 [Ohtaekwangia sp.]|nr:hypothetical protein [Ohtaekwangia sp.]
MNPPRYLTYNGETKRMSEWSEIYAIARNVLNGRFRLGWDADRILKTPVHKVRVLSKEEEELKREQNRIRQRNIDRAKAEEKRIRDWQNTIDQGMEICTVGKYFTKEHRKKCYAQLKKDFERLQQHLKVA